MSISIAKRVIGGGAPCFITFEAGPTHTGIESAKRLIDIAADAGADAIKFQIFDPDRLVADKKQLFSYETLIDRQTGKTETVQESLYEILARRYLDEAGWRAVKAHADARGLAFFATVGYEEDAHFVEAMGCDSIKVGSSDVNHHPLLDYCAKTGLVMQIDTGNSTFGEIEAAVDVITRAGNDRVIIHQCPSGYPAHIPSIHLRMIQSLKSLFPYPVGYSDHTPGWEMDVAAVAMGADLVEKTITLDRTARSPEHMFSLEAADAAAFVKMIREVEEAMGSPRREMSAEQLAKRKMTRRSAFLRTPKAQGDPLTAADIDYRRPGTGIAPTEHTQLIGMKLARPLQAGTMLRWTDLEA